MKYPLKKILVLAVALGVIGVLAFWYHNRGDGTSSAYRTAEVSRGDLRTSISATGTVEPEEVIDVGAQVAGRIVSFGQDANGKTVDYGSPVEAGTVLARIDDSLYAADVAQAEAQVQASEASLSRAEADLGQLKAKLVQAERDWGRAQKLGPSEALSQASYDAYQSAYQTAKANVAVGEATILQTRASVAQAKAGLQRAQQNLSYCTIQSPVKGVIIDRRVNTGQTVVASLNAPSLFLIAKDLKRIQVWVAVNEADIGKIHPAMPVSFTVDAFPGETFRGEVGKVRLNASMTQNVVTYTVEITTDNSSGRLLPYLTANVAFELNHLTGVLLVPNAALRWTPSMDQVSPEFRQEGEEPQEGPERSGVAPAATRGEGTAGRKARRAGILWAPDGSYVQPVRVRVGLSDGVMTEVEGKNLSEGLTVVTGVETQGSAPSDSSSPFTPKFPHRGSRNGRSK